MGKQIIILIFALLLVSYLNTTTFAQESGLYNEMMFFSNVLNHVRTNYLEEIEPYKLIEAAVYGILSSLDPHTIYLDPLQYRRFTALKEGKTCGIGFEFEIIDGLPTLISIVRGGPADGAPIRTGDILVKVNEKYIIGLTEPELKLDLSGEKGSKVKLTFRRPPDQNEFVVTLKRGDIPIHSVNYYFMLTSSAGYIKIDHFSLTTGEEFAKAINELRKKGMKNLILDLRGNPGGVIRSAVDIVDMLIPGGEIILETKGRKDVSNKIIFSSSEKKQPPYPIILLIDRGSASASEVVAGALQDHDRALIVGTNSFGKGMVQGAFILSNSGAILMTIARYYTPSGRSIQREYKGKKFEEYYTEIFTTDTLNYQNRPAFKTKRGRKVYGGGGIKPDVIVEPCPPLISNLNEVKKSKNLFKYAAEFVTDNKKFKDFEAYKKGFFLTNEMVDDFIQKAANASLDTSTFRENIDYLKILLKAEIAKICWGKKESLIIGLDNDCQLQTALEYVPKAREILKH